MADNQKDKKSLDDVQDEIKNAILNNFAKDINSLCHLDTGLGKTRIACDVLKFLSPELKKSNSYALIFYKQKGTVDTSWVKELNRLKIEYEILTGKNFSDFILTTEENKFFPHQKKVFLLSYALFTSAYNAEKVLKADCFSKNPPCIAIFDEIHQVSNSVDNKKKKTRNAISGLVVKYKLGLTATAAVNTKEEIEVIKRLLNGDNKQLSEEDFIVTDKNNTKEQMLDFNAQRYIIDLPLGNDEQEAIKKYNESNIRNAAVVEKILISGRHKDIALPAPTIKTLAIKKIIENIPSQDKILIFDTYIPPLEYLKEQDWIKSLKPCVCHGGSKSSPHSSEELKNFNERPDYRVLLATDKSAGESLNLQVANHLILLGLGWNPARINQILGRINRGDQKKDIFCYILTCNASNGGFVNQNDANRLNVIEQKNKELVGFLAANELAKCERVRFPDSETFEKEFQSWLEKILPPPAKEKPSSQKENKVVQDQVPQTVEELDDKRQLIQETIEIIRKVGINCYLLGKHDSVILCLVIVDVLTCYDFKHNWRKVKKLCEEYISAYTSASNPILFLITIEGRLWNLNTELTELIGSKLDLNY